MLLGDRQCASIFREDIVVDTEQMDEKAQRVRAHPLGLCPLKANYALFLS